jgi:hypothetical protein
MIKDSGPLRGPDSQAVASLLEAVGNSAGGEKAVAIPSNSAPAPPQAVAAPAEGPVISPGGQTVSLSATGLKLQLPANEEWMVSVRHSGGGAVDGDSLMRAKPLPPILSITLYLQPSSSDCQSFLAGVSKSMPNSKFVKGPSYLPPGWPPFAVETGKGPDLVVFGCLKKPDGILSATISYSEDIAAPSSRQDLAPILDALALAATAK